MPGAGAPAPSEGTGDGGPGWARGWGLPNRASPAWASLDAAAGALQGPSHQALGFSGHPPGTWCAHAPWRAPCPPECPIHPKVPMQCSSTHCIALWCQPHRPSPSLPEPLLAFVHSQTTSETKANSPAAEGAIFTAWLSKEVFF